MDIALFIVGCVAALSGWLVHRPIRRPAELALATFPIAWLGGELPLHALALFGGGGGALVAAGALDGPLRALGFVGLGLLVGAALAPIESWRQATRARAVLSAAVGRDVGGDLAGWRYVLPFVFRDRAVLRRGGVVREGERLRADLYTPRVPPAHPMPLLVYVHGGGWVLGFRRFQGRLLIRRLVKAGWVAVSIQYRLSPRATWPDHIVDVKRALAWARKMAPTWGADPARIAISGNSAGGHLASLAAYSPTVRDWQPGFEDVDTTVQALVSWYGIYDLDNAIAPASADTAHWPHGGMRRLWRLLVMKRAHAAARDAYRLASPVAHFHAQVPPTLLIHGTHDTLVPIASARAFARTCSEAGAPVTWLEVPGAEHAFEVFTSRRGVYAVEAAAAWLEATLVAPPEPSAIRSQKF